MSDRSDEIVRLLEGPIPAGMRVPRDVLPAIENEGLPWEYDPNYGREVDVPQDLPDDASVGILGPKLFPRFPAVWTLSCRLAYNPDVATWPVISGTLGRVFSLTGQVQYGTGGAEQTIEFDWVNGVQVTVPAATLKVAVKKNATIPFQSLPADTRVSVVMAPGSPCRSRNPTRSIYLPDASGGGGDSTLQIPLFARRVWLAGRSVAGATTLQIKTGPAATDGVISEYTATQLQDSLELGAAPNLFGPAQYVRVQGTWTDAFVVFELDA